jgi:hypothetical protein
MLHTTHADRTQVRVNFQGCRTNGNPRILANTTVALEGSNLNVMTYCFCSNAFGDSEAWTELTPENLTLHTEENSEERIGV